VPKYLLKISKFEGITVNFLVDFYDVLGVFKLYIKNQYWSYDGCAGL